VLSEYARNPSSTEALGVLNRWQARSAILLEEYFRRWEQSCGELQASGGPTCPVAKSSRRDLDADGGNY